MGNPAIKFQLYAKPCGVGSEDWPSDWHFDHAYNPSHYPPNEYYWNQTTLHYLWERIGGDGHRDSDAEPVDTIDAIRDRARRLLSTMAPWTFEFQVIWEHGECLCTRDYNEGCPVHYRKTDDDGDDYIARIDRLETIDV